MAWSPSGDATNSTVHVRERNSRFYAYAGSTRHVLLWRLNSCETGGEHFGLGIGIDRASDLTDCRLRACECQPLSSNRFVASCEILQFAFDREKIELAAATNFLKNNSVASPRCIVSLRGESEICLPRGELHAARERPRARSLGPLLVAPSALLRGEQARGVRRRLCVGGERRGRRRNRMWRRRGRRSREWRGGR